MGTTRKYAVIDPAAGKIDRHLIERTELGEALLRSGRR
jgi:hypothetical protein